MSAELQSWSAISSVDVTVEEAVRQLTICNACRYCEGYCAVFPALERRNILGTGDVSQLANLCHDCRACFDACMYSPPHEFDINIPVVLSATRLASYQRYVWPKRVPAVFRARTGLIAGAVLSATSLVVLSLATEGWRALIQRPDGAFSPYEVIPYAALLAVIAVPAVFALGVLAIAARTYWHEVDGPRPNMRSLIGALRAAMTLRYMRGGGANCPYPDNERPSPARRQMHHLVAYGFGLCLVSTISASVLQDLIGIDPPYPVLSVPVVTGTLGGLGILVGCVGLLHMKRRSSPVTNFAAMTIKDYGLLVALVFLALTGLAVLVLRTTAAFPLAFIIHMSAVLLAIASCPYSKFPHMVYRFLALVKDEQETRISAK